MVILLEGQVLAAWPSARHQERSTRITGLRSPLTVTCFHVLISHCQAGAGRSEGQCCSAGTERLGKTRGAKNTPTNIIILSTVHQTTVTRG